MAVITETLKGDLRDPEFSEGYAESFLDTYVATQIKVLREQLGLTQTQLAEALGTKQTVISRIENTGYSAWNIGTLKKLARAFHVRLHVSFETYGSLIDEMRRFSRDTLRRTPREKDPVLFGAPGERAEDLAINIAEIIRAHDVAPATSLQTLMHTPTVMQTARGESLETISITPASLALQGLVPTVVIQEAESRYGAMANDRIVAAVGTAPGAATASAISAQMENRTQLGEVTIPVAA